MAFSEIYFIIASIANLIIAAFLLLVLFYLLAILSDVKRLSKIAREEAELVAKGLAKGAGIFGNELSEEASGFIRTVFSWLLSYFAPKKSRRSRPADK